MEKPTLKKEAMAKVVLVSLEKTVADLATKYPMLQFSPLKGKNAYGPWSLMVNKYSGGGKRIRLSMHNITVGAVWLTSSELFSVMEHAVRRLGKRSIDLNFNTTVLSVIYTDMVKSHPELSDSSKLPQVTAVRTKLVSELLMLVRANPLAVIDLDNALRVYFDMSARLDQNNSDLTKRIVESNVRLHDVVRQVNIKIPYIYPEVRDLVKLEEVELVSDLPSVTVLVGDTEVESQITHIPELDDTESIAVEAVEEVEVAPKVETEEIVVQEAFEFTLGDSKGLLQRTLYNQLNSHYDTSFDTMTLAFRLLNHLGPLSVRLRHADFVAAKCARLNEAASTECLQSLKKAFS